MKAGMVVTGILIGGGGIALALYSNSMMQQIDWWGVGHYFNQDQYNLYSLLSAAGLIAAILGGILFIVGLIATEDRPSTNMPQQAIHYCVWCNGPVVWDQNYQKWYCPRCRSYPLSVR